MDKELKANQSGNYDLSAKAEMCENNLKASGALHRAVHEHYVHYKKKTFFLKPNRIQF